MVIAYMMIDNFRCNNLSAYQLDRTFVSTYTTQLINSEDSDGQGALQLVYDFSGWKKGNGAMYIHFPPHRETNRRPKKIGLFVTSEGYVPWLRLVLQDGNGQDRILNLTEQSDTWYGKKFLDAEIDGDWPLPLQLKTIYSVEVNKQYRESKEIKGRLQFSNLIFIYKDVYDWKGPFIEERTTIAPTIYKDNKEVSLILKDEQSAINPSSISVRLNKIDVPFRFEAETGALQINLNFCREGEFILEIEAEDEAGNEMIPPYIRRFTVDLSPDRLPPIIKEVTPLNGETVYASYPRISFQIIDEQSGVRSSDIKVEIMNEAAFIYYDEETGWGYALPAKPLAVGEHWFSIRAIDRAGNMSEELMHRFFVAEIKPFNDNHNILVIPDTHDASFLDVILRQINKKEAPLIIHMGDIVDGATEQEFRQVMEVKKKYENLNMLHIPGNHETFFDNLQLYRHYFGSSTYHVEYGEIVLVMLNSAYEQSLSKSDYSQFHYMKTMLELYSGKHVVFITHVPFDDPLGTAHEMASEDVLKIELIIDLARKTRKDHSITFLFGHLHILKQWKKEDVLHVITGNAARKGYGNVENGNIFGYGRFLLQENSVKYLYRPIFNSIDLTVKDRRVNAIQVGRQEELVLQIIGYVDILQTKYAVPIRDYTLFDGVWSSSDENVVHIDENGNLRGINTGEAVVTYSIHNHRKNLHVIVTNK